MTDATSQKLARIHAAAGTANPERPASSQGLEDSVTVYDPNSRTFVAKQRPKQQSLARSASQPRSTVVYDPNSRKVIQSVQPAVPSRTSETTVQSNATPASPTLQQSSRAPDQPAAATSPTGQRQLSFPVEQSKSSKVMTETPTTADVADGSRIIQTSVGPARAYVAPDPARTRPLSLEVPDSAIRNGSRGRNLSGSPSPSRSAHFSSSPIVEATRHVPPPREVSPAKSALKHSPHRSASPLANLPTSNDIQDTTSGGSGDEFAARKKKMNRVSFDEQPQAIDATPTAASRTRPPVEDLTDDDDEVMKPRPALPSFGSIRRSRHSPEPEDNKPLGAKETSSDHAVGSILHEANRTETLSNEPLPPEVTSKESAGYISDESEDLETFNAKQGVVAPPLEREMPADPTSETSDIRDFAEPSTSDVIEEDTTVPAINFLPPTPGLDDHNKALGQEGDDIKPEISNEGVAMPEDKGDEDTKHGQDALGIATTMTDDDDLPSNASEPSTLAPITYAEPRSILLDPIDEDTDDNAEFSDAAEDLSDFDEGGFASIDAIAISPINPISIPTASSIPAKAADIPPESPLASKAVPRAQSPEPSSPVTDPKDWNEATTYWSKLSTKQREQLEREHMSSDDEVRPPPATVKKTKKKTTSAKPVATTSASSAAPERLAPAQKQKIASPTTGSTQAPAQPNIKKTMRAPTQPTPAPAATTTMRTSMRAPAESTDPSRETSMRKTMRASAEPTPAPRETAMRQSMRGPTGNATAPAETTMRKSMRGPAENTAAPRESTMPKSMRVNGVGTNATTGGLSQRPQSSYIESRGSLQTKTMRPMSAGQLSSSVGANRQPQRTSAQQAPVVSARLQKELANDSDSESSFKKKRKSATNNAATMDTARYSMKRSMRGRSDDIASAYEVRPTSPTPVQKGKSSFSLRSLSPPASFMGRNRGERFNESARSSFDTGSRTTMRGSQPPGREKKSSWLGGGSKTTAAPASTPARFKSRFVDSDDSDQDEAPKRGFFRSKFADSDDEDGGNHLIVADLAPVRGIPRPAGRDDGDSTDLDEEDGEPKKSKRNRNKQSKTFVPDPSEVDKAMEAARQKLGIPVEPQQPQRATDEGSALNKGSMRTQDPAPEPKSRPEEMVVEPSERKRRGLSGFLRRNRNSTTSVPQAEQSTLTAVPSSPIAAVPPPPTKNEGLSSPIAAVPPPPAPAEHTNSQSAMDKLIGRNSMTSRMKRGDSNFSSATAPAAVGPGSENWPLPPPVPNIPSKFATARSRPSTSDGNPGKPNRSASVHFDDASKPGVVYSQRTGKKKKFRMLRRAFGLND